MRLADFILADIEPILAEWERFARGIWPSTTGDPAELRDHAEDILRAAARDMRSAQTEGERSDKSRGEGEDGAASRRLDGASADHGVGRVASGFKLKEVVAEYRALRASVIQLWRRSDLEPDRRDLEDLTRFNESIDQSLARAVASFTELGDRTRKLFLAILGHDLRNPLNAMMMSAELLQRTRRSAVAGDAAGNAAGDATGADEREAVAQISASAAAMAQMISDLLDFTGSSLGGGMPLTRLPMDLAALSREVVDEMRAAHPRCALRYESDGDLAGEWDAPRLRQVISNLVGNAVQHGSEDCGVRLAVSADGPDVVITVHNDGDPIPPEALPALFDPLVRIASPHDKPRRPGSMGLGLHIAREVLTAHGGTIGVTSSAEDGTRFTARLPRRSFVRPARPAPPIPDEQHTRTM